MGDDFSNGTVPAPSASSSGLFTPRSLQAGTQNHSLRPATPVRPDAGRDLAFASRDFWTPTLQDKSGKQWRSRGLRVDNNGRVVMVGADNVLRTVSQNEEGELFVRDSFGRFRPLSLENPVDKAFLHDLGWMYLNRQVSGDPWAGKFLNHYFDIPVPGSGSVLEEGEPDPTEGAQDPATHSGSGPRGTAPGSERPTAPPSGPQERLGTLEGTPEPEQGPSSGQEEPEEKAHTERETETKTEEPEPSRRPTSSARLVHANTNNAFQQALDEATRQGRRFMVVTVGQSKPRPGDRWFCGPCKTLVDNLNGSILPRNREAGAIEVDFVNFQQRFPGWLSQRFAQSGVNTGTTQGIPYVFMMYRDSNDQWQFVREANNPGGLWHGQINAADPNARDFTSIVSGALGMLSQ